MIKLFIFYLGMYLYIYVLVSSSGSTEETNTEGRKLPYPLYYAALC